MQPGIQRGRFDRPFTVADACDGDLAEDRQVGPGAGLIQPGQGAGRLGGGVARQGQGGAHVAVAGQGQERLEQGAAHRQKVTEKDLLDLMEGLALL